MRMKPTDSLIEKETKQKYDGGIYKPASICDLPKDRPSQFADILLNLKLSLLKKYLNSSTVVVDLCCAVGSHLFYISDLINKGKGVGIDFSKTFIRNANTNLMQKNIDNISFLVGDVKKIPIKNDSVGLVYSFSSLYHIPNVEQVIKEISRILSPGGICIIEMGNIYSLNTLVGKAYPELAYPCHISLLKMKKFLKESNLKIIDHKSFQLLPLWGDRPKYLKPLLHPFFNKIFSYQIKGKMFDEWVSSLPIIRNFVFRHIFICNKYSYYKDTFQMAKKYCNFLKAKEVLTNYY